MDIERRSAVKPNKGNQANPNQPSGSATQSATDQPDSFLVFIEMKMIRKKNIYFLLVFFSCCL